MDLYHLHPKSPKVFMGGILEASGWLPAGGGPGRWRSFVEKNDVDLDQRRLDTAGHFRPILFFEEVEPTILLNRHLQAA